MTVLPAVGTVEDKIWERDGRELEGGSVRQIVKVSMLMLAFKNLQGKVIYQIKSYSFRNILEELFSFWSSKDSFQNCKLS